jgi:hypothetical protein
MFLGNVVFPRGLPGGRIGFFDGCGDIVFREADLTCNVNGESSKYKSIRVQGGMVPGNIDLRLLSSEFELVFCRLRPCARVIVGKLYPSVSWDPRPRPAGTVPYAVFPAAYAELILVMDGVRECNPGLCFV